MDSSLSPLVTTPLTPVSLAARIDRRIALLRAWLAHDHADEPYWWARHTTAARAQSERGSLRQIANLLHVARATARGRIHGTRFASLAAQEAWLAGHEDFRCPRAAACAGVPAHATLRMLRAGELAA